MRFGEAVVAEWYRGVGSEEDLEEDNYLGG